MPATPPRPDRIGDDHVQAGLPEAGRWHRLHPLSPVVRTGRALYAVLILLVPAIASRGSDEVNFRFLGDVAIAAVLVTMGLVSWLVTRWRIEDGTLRIETGLVRRSSQRLPLVQIQAIDTVRPLLARVFGLAELRLRMAGHSGGSGRLAYLTDREADGLRARLLALAHGMAEDTPEAPERVLLMVPTGRLIGSILLSWSGLSVGVFATVLLSTAAVDPAMAGASIGGIAASILLLITALWRRFSGDFELTVSEAPDGLRLRAGLLTTSAETIPQGRVQAVRMIEPLLWRPFGWCRMQVDVAGRHRREGESEAEGRQLRAVLPVGTRDEARRLLERILPDAPPDRIPAPTRARLKTPLRYHYLSWGRNETCVVTTSGRVARVTDWVPLAKVQSLRWVQGPVQRRLRLATIHVDTAGRNVHAAIRERDATEVDRILAELITLSRTARRGTHGARPNAIPGPPATPATVRMPGAQNGAIPPRPDVDALSSAARWHPAALAIVLAGPLAWMGGSWVAWRSLAPYPPPSARIFFALGWIPILAIGLTLGLFQSVPRRQAAGVAVVTLALATPVLAARYLPGVKQPLEYPIPGRPWLAIAAAPEGRLDLYLMKGDAQHLVSFGKTPRREISAALSPDRRHMAVAATRDGRYELVVLDLDADGNAFRTRTLASGPGEHSDTTWSPDGEKVAYILRRGSSSTIEVIGVGGGTPTVLVWNGHNPAWSPDGRWIAYSGANPADDANFDVWIMRADGSDPRDVIDATPRDWAPKWSPDGRRIAFTGAFQDNWDVYLANTDGGGIQDLTLGSPDSDQAYGWSPDGSKILFLSDRSHTGGTFLYFMNPDGTNVRLALRI